MEIVVGLGYLVLAIAIAVVVAPASEYLFRELWAPVLFRGRKKH